MLDGLDFGGGGDNLRSVVDHRVVLLGGLEFALTMEDFGKAGKFFTALMMLYPTHVQFSRVLIPRMTQEVSKISSVSIDG